jgi:hypothetical protein
MNLKLDKKQTLQTEYSTGRGPINITIFFWVLSDYFYVVQYTPSSAS